MDEFLFKMGSTGEPYLYVGPSLSPSGWIIWEVGKDWLHEKELPEAEKQLQIFINQNKNEKE